VAIRVAEISLPSPGQSLVAEIDSCPSVAALAHLGKHLYALALPHD
jgi:hypothetical protein